MVEFLSSLFCCFEKKNDWVEKRLIAMMLKISRKLIMITVNEGNGGGTYETRICQCHTGSVFL